MKAFFERGAYANRAFDTNEADLHSTNGASNKYPTFIMDSKTRLSILNPRPQKVDGPRLLHDLVSSPSSALAVEHLSDGDATSISYETLHAKAEALACQIASLTSQTQGQVIVPVLLHQSPHLYIALLAILKAGGAFCPLNIDAPPNRVQFILGDVDAKVVVSTTELALNIPKEAGVTVLCVDKGYNDETNYLATPKGSTPRDLAYVMYTSGSTGTPKGVGVSHHAVTQALIAHDRHIPSFSRFLQFAAPTFDVSVFEIFFPLFRGCTLVSARRQELLDDLPAVLNRMDVDACELTPTVASSLLRTHASAPKLKLLLTIGEMLNTKVVAEFGGDESKESILWAMYGPTEAAIHCTLQTSLSSKSSTRNIGVPLDTVSCFIVEPESESTSSTEFKLLPWGEVGELAVGGEQLADGYLKNPSKTASAFISSPFGRLYRTGDKARMCEDGTIECFGRLADGQVKLRGQRIELGEVEHAALRVDGCHSAAAAIVGYILVLFAAADSGVSEEDILESCRAWLPRFMVPGSLLLLDAFPRLPSGKADIKSLKEAFESQKSAALMDSTLNDERSAKLLRLVSSHLGQQLTQHMSLSSAGVDSLTAIELASFLRNSGYDATTISILKMRTVGELLDNVQEKTQVTPPSQVDLSLIGSVGDLISESAALKEDGRTVQDILPCSPLQLAILSESMRDPQTYYNSIELELSTDLTEEDISASFKALCHDNEILRTGFVHHESTFYAVVFDCLHHESVSSECLGQNCPKPSTESQLLRPLAIRITQQEDMSKKRASLNIHHSIYDGWSMDLLMNDLSRLLGGEVIPRRPQFREVLSFYNSIDFETHGDHARLFWAEHLFGWSKPSMPKLAARPGQQGRIESHIRKSKLQCHTLQKAFSENHISPPAYFQAALALVWGGILGVSDIVLGSVTSGRTLPVDGIEHIIGPCVASMPLRVNYDGVDTVAELVSSISLSNRKIQESSALSMLGMKKILGLRASEQIYDVLFVYQDSPAQRRRQSTRVKELRHLDRLETKLVLEVQPSVSNFSMQATYHAEFFPADFVRLLMEQVDHITRQIVEDASQTIHAAVSAPGLPLSKYNMNAIQALYETEPADLAGIFEETAANHPENHAVSFATSLTHSTFVGEKVTYRQLNEQSNQIAHFLISKGAQPGGLVAILLPKSVLMYTTILGVAKARCAYLPLLPSTPTSRVSEIFRQSQPSLCLTDSETLPTLSQFDYIVAIDNVLLESFPATNPSLKSDISRLAYVIYTSGTTGVPKGVAVTNENIVNNVTYLGSIYPTSATPKLLQSCSQAFDVSVFEIFYSWHKGMCICSAPNDVLFADIEGAIRVLQITHLSLTPTVAALIHPKNVPTVEFLVTAGEPMTKAVYESWGNKLWQGYGPSETTNICTVKRMPRAGDFIEHLGWVFPNTSVAVLFPDSLQTVPIGWVGEFCFGGNQVAKAYLNMPQLTSEKFIEHHQYGRIYRSGDMGRILSDGSLLIMGRIDAQLKLRGQRIEAAEVSSVVTSTDSATEAVTLLATLAGHKNDQLVTFYAGDNRDEVFDIVKIESHTNNKLFAELLSSVPAYMVPSYLIPVSRIPLTSSGKVDHGLLKEAFSNLSVDVLEDATYGVKRDDVNEWSSVEVSIASSVAQSLGVSAESIRRWTSFTVLGLDSISAIRASQDLGHCLGITISVSVLLQNSSVAQLSRHLATTERPAQGNTDPQYFGEDVLTTFQSLFADKSIDIVSVLPCSPLQEAMLSRGKHSYYNRILLRLRVSAVKIRSYWEEMTKRHSILRTCFASTSDVKYPIAQIVLESWSIPWQVFDVTQPALDDAVNAHLKSVPEPIDAMVPPVSLALIRYRGSNFLSFLCHHALYDGVAMECLWREVEALAKSHTLPPAVSYEPFLHEVLNLPDGTEKFWRQEFRGYEPTALFEISAKKKMSQITHTTSLQNSLERVQNQLRSLGVSLLSVCQASWMRILSILSQKDDVVFGNVMSGRTISLQGIDRLVAPCFNTVPVRHNVSGSIQNIELTRSFQKLNVELLQYQFTPLRLIQKLVPNARRALFDTLLLVQQPLQEMDESVWTLEEDSGDMDIPLVCEIIPCPSLDSLVINIHHDMSAISTNLSTGIADLFKHIFLETISSPFAATERDTISVSLLDGLKEFTLPRVKAPRFGPDDNADNVLPWTEEEEHIREVLTVLSGADAKQITKSMSIFHLGLDSINAVQIASMLRQKNYAISTGDVVELQTPMLIATRMVENRQTRRKQDKPYDFAAFHAEALPQLGGIVGEGNTSLDLYPCTPVQCAMVSSFISSEGKNYFNMLLFELSEGIEAAAVLKGWYRLAEKHPMLRTGFAPVRHAHCSFAMVQHNRALSLNREMDEYDLSTFNARDWKKDTAYNILQDLHNPAWRVAVVPTKTTTVMHLAIHHALYDAQSLNEILLSLQKLIGGEVLDKTFEIRPGLSTMMQQSISSHQESILFWKQQAENIVVNGFPTMTPLREQTRSVLSAEKRSNLSVSTLQAATSKLGISVQAAIQASWCRVLASYLGEPSVTFGVTLSGRTDEATLGTPMPCLLTLPVVAQSYSTNQEQLTHMMNNVTKMQKFQHLPLASIQKALGHPGSSVFDTLLAYQKLSSQSGNKYWTQVQDDATVEYPVSLEIEPQQNDEVVLRLTYFNDILPPEQASMLLEQFDLVLEHLVMHPDGSENDLHISRPEAFAITPPEFRTMAAPVTYLHEFVESRAVSDPEKIALKYVSHFEGSRATCLSWTFRELDEIGNRVANMLRSRTKANSIIAIHFDKCPEAYFAILGILKSGSSFVALDPNAPSARKEFILEDSNAPCLLTDAETVIDFDVTCPIIRIDEVSLREFSSAKCNVDGITPNSTCYCLYTSGTTGTPKGCEITHENAVQCMIAFQELFKGHWSDDSQWLQFAALHFDVSVLEQYWSWSVGMAVVSAKKEMILDDLIGFINALQITHIDLTPSLARLTHPDTVPTLCKGIFITGGEQLKQEILDAWGSKAVIYNAYGPTEATIGVTMYKRVPQNGRPSNIGQQFPNVGSYVFRQGTEIPVLRGGVGELCVSGKLVGKGYLNRPKLTDERFPTLQVFGERIYRTGDLVRILHDGCFEFLGRADDQVKLRGQRLEIGEIDHVIRSLPQIHDGATIVTKHTASGKDVLVAFVVGDESKNEALRAIPDSTGLGVAARAACREKLPGYMVPSYFISLPFIPLSPNNKAEANTLKALFSELTQDDLSRLSAPSPEQTTIVDSHHFRKLTRAVADFCAVSEGSITPSTSIFDLGVDSIIALQLATTLQQSGFPGASPAVVLRNSMLADLSVALSSEAKDNLPSVKRAKQLIQATAHKHRPAICRTLGIQADDVEFLHPCSPLQQGIIAKAMTGQEAGVYFNSFQMLLHPHVSLERLKIAWEALVQQIPILRCSFVNTSDGYMQLSLRNSTLSWDTNTLNKLEDLDTFSRTQWRRWVASNQDTIVEPLQILYVETEATRRLVIHIFHGVYDGTSFDLIMRNIWRLYRGGHIKEGPLFMDALAYGPLWDHKATVQDWKEHLTGWVSSPIDIGLSEQAKYDQPMSVSRTIGYSDIEDVRQRYNMTTQSVLLAIWTATLQRYSKGALTTGVIISGRTINLKEAQDTIGPLFNTLPFFTGNSTSQTWPALLDRCQKFNDLVLEDPHVPLQSVQKCCSNGQALFDNLFTYQIEDDSDAAQDLWDVEVGPAVSDYTLALEVTKLRDNQMRLYLVAQDDIGTQSILEQILDEFKNNVELLHRGGDLPRFAALPTHLTATEAQSTVQPSLNIEFQWTPAIFLMRHELAALANIPDSKISPLTSILELGLDSIDVLQLTSRLRHKGILIPASKIMKLQTLAKMAGNMELAGENDQASRDNDQLEKLQKQIWDYLVKEGYHLDSVEAVLPPTPLQEAMISGMIESDFKWYFNHEILEVVDGVDVAKLKAAWRTTIDRSPILRTGFAEVTDPSLDMSYAAIVYNRGELTLNTVFAESVDELQTVIEKTTRRAMAGNGRQHLVQTTFVDVGSKTFIVFSIAHALYDGWSLNLIHQDLQRAYYVSWQPRPSPNMFLVKSKESLNTDATNFWANYLDGAQGSIVAGEHQADTTVSRKSHDSHASLVQIGEFCKDQEISLQALLQACWAAIVAYRTRSLDILFGAVLSGRDFEGADELMFPTMNTVAVRSILHGTISSFLRYTEGNLADMREYQHYPLRKAHAAAKLRGGLFDSLFLLQKAPVGEPQTLFKSVDGSSAVDYPICVEAEAGADTLTWTVACQGQSEPKLLAKQLTKQLDDVLLYFLSHQDEDVVIFGDSEASICGLPPIEFVVESEETRPKEKAPDTQWSETALAIRSILSSVSCVPEDSIHDSSTLYHLGLDSITAIKVSSLLKRKNLIIKPTELVRATSISEMADTVEQKAVAETATNSDEVVVWSPPANMDIAALLKRSSISHQDLELLLPATPMQVHMLSVWQNTNGQIFYPEFWYLLSEKHAAADVEAAWKVTCQSHPMLRTCFLATDNKDMPFIQATFKTDIDLPSYASTQLLAGVTVQKGEDGPKMLCLHIHHALYDGVSLPTIMETLSKALSSQVTGITENMNCWVNYTSAVYSPSATSSRRKFWTRYLQGIPAASNSDPISASASRTAHLKRQAMLIMAFSESAVKNGISIQALAFAAYARSIAKSGIVVMGIYLANRAEHADVPRSFPTLNLVPLRVHVEEQRPILEVARQIQEDMRRISSGGNAQVGLWEIFSWTGLQITHFVNFLTLPDTNDESQLLELDENHDQPRQVASQSFNASHPSVLNNPVRHAYPASMDVEMSVRNGALDIGVFGPSSLVTLDDAEALIGRITEHLKE